MNGHATRPDDPDVDVKPPAGSISGQQSCSSARQAAMAAAALAKASAERTMNAPFSLTDRSIDSSVRRSGRSETAPTDSLVPRRSDSNRRVSDASGKHPPSTYFLLVSRDPQLAFFQSFGII